MKNLIKKYNKIVLFVGVLLFSCEAFSASEATKRMIHDVLSKYCIPNDKTVCNTPYEGHYDPNYNFCLCEDDGMVYSKSQRKCVEVPAGTYYQKSMKTNIPKKCEPGTYSGSGASSCTSCPLGQYASGYGNTGCEPCPAGKYASGSGSASCSPCWAGSYQPNSGQSTCWGCPTNHTTSGTGSTSYNDCYCTCTYGCRSDNSCKECNSSGGCSGNYGCNNNGSCVCNLQPQTCKKVENCTLVNKCSGTYPECDTTGSKPGKCYYTKTTHTDGYDSCEDVDCASAAAHNPRCCEKTDECTWNKDIGRNECWHEGSDEDEKVYEP